MVQSTLIASIDQELFNVIDRHTGCIVRKNLTKKAARNAVDRLDNQYGGYRYSIQDATGQARF